MMFWGHVVVGKFPLLILPPNDGDKYPKKEYSQGCGHPFTSRADSIIEKHPQYLLLPFLVFIGLHEKPVPSLAKKSGRLLSARRLPSKWFSFDEYVIKRMLNLI
jgi:hypothetical protein